MSRERACPEIQTPLGLTPHKHPRLTWSAISMINVNTPIKSQSDFKETLSRFEYSTPTRKSARLDQQLKRTIVAVDSSSDEEKTPTKKAKVKAKAKSKRGYASPEKYAHLSGLNDILAPDLDGMLYQGSFFFTV